jgi:hypothetical protein
MGRKEAHPLHRPPPHIAPPPPEPPDRRPPHAPEQDPLMLVGLEGRRERPHASRPTMQWRLSL